MTPSFPLSVLILLASAFPQGSHGAPHPEAGREWAAHEDANPRRVDHNPWQEFLRRYVDTTAPDGIHRVRYREVSKADRAGLDRYLGALQRERVGTLARAEQMAYWINLYNAKTVDLVLRHYPVASIRDIDPSGKASGAGPWDAKLLLVEGRSLSLNDVEHRILRPIWKDNRIHFALNCASLGCPDLAILAFTRENTPALLEKGARAFVQSPRGAAFEGEVLVLSSIFDWYRDDFGGGGKGVLDFLSRHAAPSFKAELSGFGGKIRYHYDWALNDVFTARTRGKSRSP